MKMIILAAGQGTRLRPLTNNKPKCMVEYKGKPIIDYIIDVAHKCEIKDISIVNGYKKDVLEKYLKNKDVKFFTNELYTSTNMVSTLFCADDFMDDDVIISYSDIIFTEDVLKKLIVSKNKFNVVIDKKWRKLWSARMENPLDDAETLKVKNGKIIEIGKVPSGYADIEGQYIGLIKISKNVINDVKNHYNKLDKNISYDGKSFDNMYMTTFIQNLIDNLLDVDPVYINGNWIEIDSLEDLENLKNSTFI